MNIKFAIVGFGHIDRRFATIGNEYPGADVVAVVDINDAAKEYVLFPKGAQIFNTLGAFKRQNWMLM
jgi:glyceraldehyde-3-phosphate dehydrogenase/erythrose-4-phosphate dehydrogenase